VSRDREIQSIDDAALDVISERVRLRPITGSDAEAIHAYVNDPLTLEHLALERQTPAQTEAYVADALTDNSRRPRVRYRLVVVSREQGEVLGDCLLRIDVPLHDRQGEIGFLLRPDQWDRGFGTELARLLVELGFRRIGLHRIYAHVRPDNARSVRVLEKLGMRLEGRFREHRWIRGNWRDSLLYGLLEHESQ
jgi:RimJ/RimL family protein N-acetyltransferase